MLNIFKLKNSIFLCNYKPYSLINFVKFDFARKNKPSTQNLFTKFSTPEEGENNSSENSNNQFKKILKKQYQSEGFESLEDKKLSRLLDQKISQGKTAKQVAKEIMQERDDENQPSPSSSYEDRFQDEQEDKIVENLYKDEIEKIKKIREQRKFLDVQNETNDDSQLYTEKDLNVIKRAKLSKQGMEEKDSEYLDKFKFKEADDDSIGEAAENFKFNKKKSSQEDPQHEEVKKKFYKSFEKNFEKNKKNKKIDLSKLDDEDGENQLSKIKDLRKIKNLTSREYSIGEYNKNQESSVDLVDTIPDINLVEKRSKNFEMEESFRSLVEQDVHPYDKQIERRENLIQDALKLSKMNTLNIVNIKKHRDEIFKKKALNLAKVWNMDAPETKHWYYRLKREEKQIFKAILMRKKLEQKRNLKKIAKQWKIENEENIDINYLQLLKEENGETGGKNSIEPEKFTVPKEYKNLNEFMFFGEDKEYFRHYKRTCKNIMTALNEFFESNKQTIRRGISMNVDIMVQEVKMNKACTVVYIWWDLPSINSPLTDMTEEDQNAIFKNVELNLVKSAPYLKGFLTRRIGLKYAPDIRFLRDTLDQEVMTFEKEVVESQEEFMLNKHFKKQSKQEKILRLLDNEEMYNNLRQIIDKINHDETRNRLEEILFGGDDEAQTLSQRLILLSTVNPTVYQGIFDFIKNSFGINEENIDEIYSKMSLTPEGKKLQKQEKKSQKRREKALKKVNLKEEDLQEKNEMPNLSNSINNFLQQYDRKIPGQKTLNPTLKEMKDSKDKKDFIDEITDKRVKRELKKEVRRVEKIGRTSASRRNKSEEFWKSLDNYV
jgi:hypothetical protein